MAAALIVGLGLAVRAAFAGSVSLDTGVATWMINRTLAGFETQANLDGGDTAGDSDTSTAVDVAEPVNIPYFFENSWVQADTVGDGNAQWISFIPGTGVGYDGDWEDSSITDDGTSYVYTDTFKLKGGSECVARGKWCARRGG